MITASDSYNRILESYDTLPKQQKKIADYIISHYDEVVFFTITKLAATLDVSEATIVRFSQNLGHKGFPELKDSLTQYYRKYLTPGERMKRSIEELPDDPFQYGAHIQREISLLEQSVTALDNKSFIKAIDQIIKANRLFIFGSGGNECLANHLAFRLSRFKLKAYQHSVSGKSIVERFLHVEKNDLVIVFHFYKPTIDFRVLMNICRDKGANVLLVTDNLIPPMVKGAGIILHSPRGSLGTFHTQVVPMAICNALINGVSSKLGNKAVKALEELNDLRQKHYFSNMDSTEN